MADTTTKPVLSVIATIAENISNLVISNGQLIFIRDAQTIALDYDDTRIFYNQIVSLDTDEDREELTSPIEGLFYFVIGTAVLWRYQSEWVQVTTSPEEIVFIGTSLPELGSEQTLYVNKNDQSLSVWDSDSYAYITVGNVSGSITDDEIIALF